MSDLISRQAAMDEMSKQQTYKMFVGEDTLYLDANDVGSVLASLPSAQPEHGRREVIGQPYMRKHFNPVCCSICKRRGYNTPYCPHCGAYMVDEEE